MFNPLNLIQQQKQQKQQQKDAEKQRIEIFSKLMQGNVCTREELETMQMKHQMYKEQGHYISVTEKDSNGHNIQPKEIMDIYYIPIPTMMAEIKILNKRSAFVRDAPRREAMLPLEQKYFQSILLKYCFGEIRASIRRCYENINAAVQKLILGKYSFERFLNYEQRLSVSTKDRKCIVAEEIDITIVPVPKLSVSVPKMPVTIVPVPIDPAQIVHQETQRAVEVEVIAPRTTMVIHPIGAYENPMDYYLEVIQWCRRCAHYDNCSQVLREAIIELMGNEGKYKEVFSNPIVMLQFVQSFARRHQYFVAGFGGERKYTDSLIKHIERNGRFLIMQKVSRMLGHWGLPQDVKKAAYVALKNHTEVTHQQIREMYLDPKKLLSWLKKFIPSSYTSKEVDAAMGRHGFYYY